MALQDYLRVYLQVNLKVNTQALLGSHMASPQQQQILEMRQDIADGDESIGTYVRPIRDRTDEHTTNVPAPVLEVLGLEGGDKWQMELYLDRVEVRPVMEGADE